MQSNAYNLTLLVWSLSGLIWVGLDNPTSLCLTIFLLLHLRNVVSRSLFGLGALLIALCAIIFLLPHSELTVGRRWCGEHECEGRDTDSLGLLGTKSGTAHLSRGNSHQLSKMTTMMNTIITSEMTTMHNTMITSEITNMNNSMMNSKKKISLHRLIGMLNARV